MSHLYVSFALFLDEVIRKSLCCTRFPKAWIFIKFRALENVCNKMRFLSEYPCNCQTWFLTARAGKYWTHSRPFNRSLCDIFTKDNQSCGCAYICKFSWLYWNWSWKKYVIGRNFTAVSSFRWAVKIHKLGIYFKNFQESRHFQLKIVFLLLGKCVLVNLLSTIF